MAGVLWCWTVVFSFFVLPVNSSWEYKRESGEPVPEFSRHTVIKPRIYHGREKREISSTKEKSNIHAHDITVGFNAHGKDFILDLKLNRDLIPNNYFHKYHHKGKHVVNTPTKKEVELCYYLGNLRGIPDSWAAVSSCQGLSGVVFDGEELHFLEPVPGHESLDHFLYAEKDLISNNHTCGYTGTNNHQILLDKDINRILRYKRSAETIHGPYNANRKSRYVELVLVVDNAEYKELGEDLAKTYHRCKEIANIVNALYVPLNIFVALVGVVVWSERDEIQLSPEGDTTLTNFLHYRTRLVKEHPNDNAQLLTGVQFQGGVVGKALKGPICTYQFSGGVNMDHSALVALVATTVAHELGHNFGMEHDEKDCLCPSERCIMAPSSNALHPTHWSSCSLEYLALAFEHGMDYCLRNKPESLFDGPVCGNGFVEPGEECDCGMPDMCGNPCCNASTCTLYRNATCATGECCDLKTCKPKVPGFECRSAEHECDLPEFCTGESEYCPKDVFKIDGETCSNGKAFCFRGFCRTHSDQCKLLWGPSGKNSETQCYTQNNKGTRHGNCGYLRVNQSYLPCDNDNVLCGMLHCSHLNERLEFGMESVATLSHSFMNYEGRIIPCRSAIVDLGLNEIDPGLVPDGAKCGANKMCVNQRCMPVSSLQNGGCTFNCNGNGLCNSRGHCHCDVGFSPPFCDYPGPGGSQDSGPASDPNGPSEVVTVVYIIFLGVVPLLALLAFLIYYMQRNLKFWCKRGPHQTGIQAKHTIPPRRAPSFKSDGNALRKLDISHPIADGNASDCATTTLLPHKKKPLISSQTNGFIIPQPISPAAASKEEPSLKDLQNNLIGHFQGFTLTPLPTTKASDKPTCPPIPPTEKTVVEKEITVTKPRPLSTPEAHTVHFPEEVAIIIPNKEEPINPSVGNPTVGNPLSRIASFLRSSNGHVRDGNSTLPRHNSVKATKIDRESLRNLQISSPILQKEINLPEKVVPLRPAPPVPVQDQSESVKEDSTTQQRPQIQSFGSMRGKRPVSLATTRPTSPPPRPPPPSKNNEESSPDAAYLYDDCMNLVTGVAPLAHIDEENSPNSTDNIYAVIDEIPKIESPPTDLNTSEYMLPTIKEQPNTNQPSSGSTESVGLLSEIVSEIQARNLDSIYTSTLGRRKKEKERQDAALHLPESSTETTPVTTLESQPILSRDHKPLYTNMSPNFPTTTSPSTTFTPRSSVFSSTSNNAYLNPTRMGGFKPITTSAASLLASIKPTTTTVVANMKKPETFSTFKGPLKTYSLDNGLVRESPKLPKVIFNKTDDEKTVKIPKLPGRTDDEKTATVNPRLNASRPGASVTVSSLRPAPSIPVVTKPVENAVVKPVPNKPVIPRQPAVTKPVTSIKSPISATTVAQSSRRMTPSPTPKTTPPKSKPTSPTSPTKTNAAIPKSSKSTSVSKPLTSKTASTSISVKPSTFKPIVSSSAAISKVTSPTSNTSKPITTLANSNIKPTSAFAFGGGVKTSHVASLQQRFENVAASTDNNRTVNSVGNVKSVPNKGANVK